MKFKVFDKETNKFVEKVVSIVCNLENEAAVVVYKDKTGRTYMTDNFMIEVVKK